MELQGIFPALTTPFEDDEVAVGRLRANLESYERQGFGGYLVLGSTGEGILLDDKERRVVLEAARDAIPEGKPMLAGVAAESTAGALTQANDAALCGANFVLVITPHYFRSQMIGEALLSHYRTVADGSPVPVLLYNVPKFTGLDIPPGIVARLARHGNIAGIKESSGNLVYLQEILASVEERFTVLCGDAAILDAALESGATGGVLAAAVAFPEPFIRIANSDRGGGTGRGKRLRKAAEAAVLVAGTHGVPGVKAAMDLRGLYGGPPRSPLQPVSEEVGAEIDRIVTRLVADGTLPNRIL